MPEIKAGNTTKRGEKSRFETLGAAAVLPPNPAPHITDWLLEIGPTGPDGSGLGWRDLTAWQDITGIVLEPWEARLIKRLSGEYASMRVRGERHDCAAPYSPAEVMKDNRERVNSQFAAMVKAVRRARQKEG